MSQPRHEHGRGWCSLRLRFSDRELALLRGAEKVRGAALAAHSRPDLLRSALLLAKAGHKIGHAAPAAALVFDESELSLLLEAVRFANDEVHWATGPGAADADAARQQSIFQAFPELVERGLWRSFALTRDLEALRDRLHAALAT